MGISILAPFLGTGMPITVLQMLWINIVMDTLAGLAYGGERPRKSYMAEPPKKRSEPIINNYMWGQIVYASVIIGFMSLLFLRLTANGTIYAMTAFFAFFMFINIFNAFNSRTHDINLGSYMSLNKPFLYIMTIVAAAQVLLIYFGGKVFRTVPLSFVHLAIIIAIALMILPLDLLRKVYLRKKFGDKLKTT
jgi:magnesium-transporting ATPase (P-type)